jgi:translation initiation factor 1 (eIF-1/SUI1)
MSLEETIGLCPCCKLPWELCDHIKSENVQINIRTEDRALRKKVTIVEGLKIKGDDKKILDAIKTFLSKKLCCGRSNDINRLEFQGDHRTLLQDVLQTDFGFEEYQIEII